MQRFEHLEKLGSSGHYKGKLACRSVLVAAFVALGEQAMPERRLT